MSNTEEQECIEILKEAIEYMHMNCVPENKDDYSTYGNLIMNAGHPN